MQYIPQIKDLYMLLCLQKEEYTDVGHGAKNCIPKIRDKDSGHQKRNTFTGDKRILRL